MAPKKAAGKDKVPSDVATLYEKREPLAPRDPPNVEEIEGAWKVARDAFLCPLPEWDEETVDTTEWNPNETQPCYYNESFCAKLLPRPFTQHISAWKRAHSVSDNSGKEESAPDAKPPPPLEEPVVDLDPKAKGKAKAAPAAKGGKDPAAGGKPTTQAQFAEVQYTGDSVVVSPGEFNTRLFELTNDDSMPPLSQAIAAQIAIVGEHGRILPQGCFLWELIYPQNEYGVPIVNPHGKYIVKLYVQGKWRAVMVDDVMPVGSASGSSSLHAPVFPASAAANAFWPMILSKALLRAYQHDLKAPILPAVQALTGMSLFQLPMSWQGLRSAYESRPFCCLQMSSKVDIEARQREALMMASAQVEPKQQKDPRAKGAALGVPSLPALDLGAGGLGGSQAPKLGANPVDALLQFLVCELEDDPQQVRLKAATWRPMGGTPRKVVLDVAESEGPDEEEDLPRADQEDRQSDAEEHDEDEEEGLRSGQRSPSGEVTVPSARSKEEPGLGDEAQLAAGDSTEVVEEKPPGAIWPDSYPSSLMPKSESMDYHDLLLGGYWVGIDVLKDVCDSFIIHLPPGTSSLSAHLDTCWQPEARIEAYAPRPMSLLRLCLTPADLDLELEPTPRDFDDPITPRERGPPWHKTVFQYEPVRMDPGHTPSGPLIGPGFGSASCMLQGVNQWNPMKPPKDGPEHVNFLVTETGGSSASRSILLPSGEHWYLVFDDALKAGSVLSAHVDGAMLSRSKSTLEFLDPTEFLPSVGIAMSKLGSCEYPPQRGFSVWAKAEVIINTPELPDFITVFCYISDATLRSCLRVALLRLEQEPCDDPTQRCAHWSATTLTRVPLQQVMSLALRSSPAFRSAAAPRAGDGAVKYILVLEANVPAVAKGGTYSLHVMLPPEKGNMVPAKPADAEDGGEASSPLQLVDLKVDQITRWSGDVVKNEKGIVLRERIVVPHGTGDVTATIRVTITGLPKIGLNAQLMAQMLPTPEMRPKAEGVTPEPFQPGAPVDSNDYNGRKNWLASRRIVAEESGSERVMFMHVLLCEGATYLLDVYVDPYKGPDKLEGGQWILEMFGSSAELEIGADTMEQDLEALVRKSWEETAADAPQPPRNERAAATRKKWLRKRGLLPGDSPDLDEEPAAAAPKAEAKAEPKAKSKPGKDGKVVEAEPEVDKEQQEAEWLAAALQRAGMEQHSNAAVDEFVNVHTAVEPTLVEEDPYTIAPVLDDMPNEENPDVVAIHALGMRGSAEVQQGELDFTIAKWEKIQEEVADSITRNKQALIDLTQWSEEVAGIEPQFKELRESLRNGLQSRYQAKESLKALVGDAEKLDPAELQTALDEAAQQDVSVWDPELVETGSQKKSFIEDFNALRDRLSKLEAEPLAEEESREALSKLSLSVGQLQKQLKKKKLPLPPEMFEKELFQQAADAIAAAIAALAEADEEQVEGS